MPLFLVVSLVKNSQAKFSLLKKKKKKHIKSKLKGQILGASVVFNKPRIIIEKTFPTIIPFDLDFSAKPCLWRLS